MIPDIGYHYRVSPKENIKKIFDVRWQREQWYRPCDVNYNIIMFSLNALLLLRVGLTSVLLLHSLKSVGMSRFAKISEEEEGSKIIDDKDAKETKKQTRVAMNAFNCWLAARNHTLDEQTIAPAELDALLYQFYLEVRKQDGKMYSKNGFRGLRHGVQRYFKKKRSIDIIHDADFTRSSMSYAAQCVVMKKNGLAKVEHKEPIIAGDMERLYSCGVFDVSKPKSLQRKVFFELEYYFCRRSMENLRLLTTESLW